MRVDFFVRTWNRNPARRQVWSVTVQNVKAGITLASLIALAHANGVNKGTAQTGLVEIQTDEGIWAREDGNRLDASTPARAAKCIFKTWDQLEAEEKNDDR